MDLSDISPAQRETFQRILELYHGIFSKLWRFVQIAFQISSSPRFCISSCNLLVISVRRSVLCIPSSFSYTGPLQPLYIGPNISISPWASPTSVYWAQYQYITLGLSYFCILDPISVYNIGLLLPLYIGPNISISPWASPTSVYWTQSQFITSGFSNLCILGPISVYHLGPLLLLYIGPNLSL